MQEHTLQFTIEMPNGFTYNVNDTILTDWDPETIQSWADASITQFVYHSSGDILITDAALDGEVMSPERLEVLTFLTMLFASEEGLT